MIEVLKNSPLVVAALYAFVAAMTPGPNNLMLLSSGMTFGLRRTLPHMLGAAGGFLVLITAIAAGVGAAIAAVPAFRWLLLLGGSAFMAYLAFRIMTAPADLKQRESKRPLNFYEAAAFQAINPKAWGFSLSYMALIVGVSDAGKITFWLGFSAVVISMGTTLCSTLTWVGLGRIMARLIDSPQLVRVINVVLGLTLFLMIPLMFWSELNDILAG